MTALEKYVETMKNPIIVVNVDHGDIDVVDMEFNPENVEKLLGGVGSTNLHPTPFGDLMVAERAHPLELGLPINMNMLPFFYVGTVVICSIDHNFPLSKFKTNREDVPKIISWILNDNK